MNKFAARALAADAKSGRRILVVTRTHSEAVLAQVEVFKVAGGKLRRANGSECISYEDGGEIMFRGSGACVRGLSVDTVFVDHDVSQDSIENLKLCAMPHGELVRA